MAKKKFRNPHDWLLAQTGLSLPDWIIYIQQRIVKRSRPSKDPDHDQTDTSAWIADLEKAIRKSWKAQDQYETECLNQDKAAAGIEKPRLRSVKKRFDENMRMAATMGLIMCAWYCRVQLAKTQDPNRPVELRRQAHDRWCGWYQAHCVALVDSRHDPELFPFQEWESPFKPGARSGKFV